MRKEKQGVFLGPLGARLLSILLLVTAQCAQADRKTDVITLHNGDRITGEIKSLGDGKLTLSTDAMGTINVEWQEVASLDSNYNYEVRLSDGQRFFGSPHAGAAPGLISLEDVFGQHSFEQAAVVEVRPVEDSVTDRLDIYLSANYAFTKASGVRQTEFNADISYSDRDAINSLTSRLTVSDTEEDSTVSSRINAQRRTWTDRRNVYRLLFGGFESNDELALDSRYTLGAGIGRYFVDSNRSSFTGGVGLQGLTERSQGGETQDSLEAVITTEYARWRFDTPELDISLKASVYPSLTESGRVRADNSARLRWEIIEDLYWNLNAWSSYDNKAVDEAGGEFDWGVNTGVGWNF